VFIVATVIYFYRRLSRVQTVCDMLQVPPTRPSSSQSKSHFAHCALQAAAAAVAKGSASVDDLLDTVTVLRLECVPECAPILLYLRFK